MSTKIVDVDVFCFDGYSCAMSPEQCRAARNWIEWSQDELAKAAGVGLSTVRDFEKGKRTPIGNNLLAIQRVLQNNGIAFSETGITGPIPFKPRV